MTEPKTIVICGWNVHGQRLVDDLQQIEPPVEIVIVSEGEAPSVVDDSGSEHGLRWMNAPPTSNAVLETLSLDEAQAVVVLATSLDTTAAEGVDARSILTVLSVRALSKRCHIIVELLDEENLSLAKAADVDEVLLNNRYAGVMLSQAIQSIGLGDFFGDLFRSGAGAALREVAVAETLVGSRFSEAMLEAPALKTGALVGVRRGEEFHIPPRENLVLRAEDRLLVIRSG